MYPRRGDTRCDPVSGSSPQTRSVSKCCAPWSSATQQAPCRLRSGSCELVGSGLKVTLGELPPPARFLQVRLFKLDHDLTWITRARPNEGSLTPQMGNCSDIPLATRHYSTSEMAYKTLFHRRIVRHSTSQVLEHPASVVYATAALGLW
jgi:hypothetical protein